MSALRVVVVRARLHERPGTGFEDLAPIERTAS